MSKLILSYTIALALLCMFARYISSSQRRTAPERPERKGGVGRGGLRMHWINVAVSEKMIANYNNVFCA